MNSFFMKLLQGIYIIKSNKNFLNIYKNTFRIEALLKKSKCRINGKNNLFMFGVGKYKRIKIGIDGNHNKIIIEDGVVLNDLEIIIQANQCEIHIGANTEIGGAKIVCCEHGDHVNIGKNCLIADDVEFWVCDGHSIYQNGERINQSKPITIQDHVWIGRGVKVLKGTELGTDSIVGMGSIVTAGIYPSQSLLAGVPAKIVKNNIGWGVER